MAANYSHPAKPGEGSLLQSRWPVSLVAERWDAFTPDEREAQLRYGNRQAPWESVPDTAHRILKSDPKITLANTGTLMAVFRAAYDELAGGGV